MSIYFIFLQHFPGNKRSERIKARNDVEELRMKLVINYLFNWLGMAGVSGVSISSR